MAHAATESELAWIAERSGAWLSPKARGIIAFDASGIRGGVALDNWTRNSAHVHIALDTPIAARSLRPALERYVRQLGLGVLLGVIQADNAKSIRLAEHFGFEQAYRLRDGWDEGRDLLFFEWRKR